MKRFKHRTGYLMKTATGFRARFRVAGRSVYYPLASIDRALATKEMDGIASRLNGDTAQVIDNLRGLLARLEGASGHGSLPVRDGWDAYVASTARPLSGETTMKVYQSHWTAFAKWCGDVGIDDMADIDQSMAKRFVLSMESDGITSSTCRARVSTLRMMWKYLFDGARNPWASVKVRRQDQMVIKQPFTADHLKLVLNSAPVGEMRDLMWILAYTGMRLGDGCLLRCESVKLDRGVIEFLPAKTGKRGERPMSARVGIHKVIEPIVLAKLNGRKSGFLLQEMSDMYKFHRTKMLYTFSTYLASLGIETRVKRDGISRSGCVFGWHSFRHSLQSRLADAGYGGLVADQILCHKQGGSLGQHYTHISDSVLVDAIHKAMPDFRDERGVVIQMKESA